jgi:hypothetical protein
MEINGKLYVKVDDEQLDEIVVKHCQAALDACTSVLELEAAAAMKDKSNFAQHHIDTILDYENYSKALRTVIMFFGGEPIDTSENALTEMESTNETTNRST